ncbi:hypothetical protein E2C01_020514 [Portunus trituberculatus]|uniref:Uncharacterized protein n=1 Tax=Portunus trituberculatus TaxID=210409 RepID=A0A5B7E1P6_PORTR|nr:hypothetical protein [Portunus trituberculatus]
MQGAVEASCIRGGSGIVDKVEDEGAVCIVVAHQVPVAEALQPRDGDERQLSHNSAIKANYG